jgi:hypothetical protein
VNGYADGWRYPVEVASRILRRPVSDVARRLREARRTMPVCRQSVANE